MPEKIDSVAVEVHINLNGPLWSSEFNLLFARNIKFLLSISNPVFTSTHPEDPGAWSSGRTSLHTSWCRFNICSILTLSIPGFRGGA